MEMNKSRISIWTRRLIPSIEGVIGIVIFTIVLTDSDRLLLDSDTGWHIRTGDYILDKLEVPKVDIFSHTKYGQTWIAHEWLSDVVFALFHKLSGLTGVVVLSGYLISITFVVLFKALYAARLNILIVTVVTILAALTSYIHWLVRPHLFSFLLTVVWSIILESHQTEPKRSHIFLLPALMVLWVNLHGGYLLGFMLIGVYGLGNIIDWFLTSDVQHRQQLKKRALSLGAIGTLCLLATLINPYGYRILLFPLEILGAGDVLPYVGDWQSPTFRTLTIYQIYFQLLVAALLISRKRLSSIQVILLLMTIHMFLSARRYIPLFALLTAPMLARALDDLFTIAVTGQSRSAVVDFLRWRMVESTKNLKLLNDRLQSRVFPLTLGLCALFLAYTGGELFGTKYLEYEFRGISYPAKAIEFLKQEPLPGNMYNHYYYGGYLIYRLFPDERYRVFADGRAIVGGKDYFTEHQKVDWMQPQWSKILEKHRVNWIIEMPNSSLSTHLVTDPAWKLIYADERANIFIRNTKQNEAIIQKYKDVKPVVDQ
jgi:hypothetical protein